MPANVEIKAVLDNPEAALRKLQQLSDCGPEVIEQDDRFYSVPRGRLKMRCDVAGKCELVYYRRENAAGPRISSYFREALADPTSKHAELARTYGTGGRVRKRRKVFFVRGIRVHVDEVEGLGTFLEIEVPIKLSSAIEHARAVARQLMRQLDIEEEALVAESYEELLAKRNLQPVDTTQTN